MTTPLSKTAAEADKAARLDCACILAEMADNAAFESMPYQMAREAILKSIPADVYYCPKCSQYPAVEGRVCPYSDEINDRIVECDCCENCNDECLGGI